MKTSKFRLQRQQMPLEEFYKLHSKTTSDGYIYFQDPEDPNQILWFHDGKWVDNETMRQLNMGQKRAQDAYNAQPNI